jgi:Family of unknown function (DUF6064)
MLPFSQEQFLAVFERYNLAVWPVQVILHGLALVVAGLAVKPFGSSSGLVASVLAFFWLWMGVVYHGLFFAAINPAAYLFGALCVTQGVLFLHAGVVRRTLSFHFTWTPSTAVGGLLLVYALVVYPLLGHLLGHRYPAAPSFGVPCPTTIFTFGLLLWTDRRLPTCLLVIPFLWSLVGSTAAVLLTITQDFGLLVAGVVGTALILYRNRVVTEPVERTEERA